VSGRKVHLSYLYCDSNYWGVRPNKSSTTEKTNSKT